MIINLLREAQLNGRSGSGFPTAKKWESVLDAVKNAKEKKCYVICNAAEGEPAVFKDGYILEHYPDEVINGIKIALDTLGAEKAYIYLKRDYLKKFKKILEKLIGDLSITLFAETGGYLCGEETTLMESIEGHRNEPRLRPPFPTTHGLFGFPTLVNNVETFYCVSKISKGEYKHTRFYSVSGDVKNPGVYELPQDWPVGQILAEGENIPAFKFFAQVGGGASGAIMLQDEMTAPVSGAASIVVYNLDTTNPVDLMKQWMDFYFNENCGKCVPCREGFYRIKEMLDNNAIDLPMLRAVLEVMRESSFCPLGKGAAYTMESLLERVVLSI